MEIWQEIHKNKERGAERLVAEYGDRLYAATFVLCQNPHDAEELAFRTFDQAVKKIHLFSPEKSFFTWLYQIALNFRRMDLRKCRAEVYPMGAPAELPEVSSDAFAELLGRSTSDELVCALKALPKVLREAVVLRYFEDCSVEEVADALNIPVGTAKSRLFHARTALYESLKNLKRRS